jgi:GntR family transcriptional regulator
MAKIPVYQQLAAQLRAAIEAGAYPPGSALPVITDLADQRGVNQHTVRQAYKLLEAQGLVSILGRHGTVVRPPVIRIPLSRYGKVLTPGPRGPWETITAELGVDGVMSVLGAENITAPNDVSEALNLEPGCQVHQRRRAAMIGTDTHHYQVVWYPIDVADQIGLTGPDKVVGGIYAAMVRVGRPPAEVDEVIRFRAPTPAEVTGLRTSPTSVLAVIDRVTRDQTAHAMELLRVTVPTDRVELMYDRLPIGEAS